MKLGGGARTPYSTWYFFSEGEGGHVDSISCENISGCMHMEMHTSKQGPFFANTLVQFEPCRPHEASTSSIERAKTRSRETKGAENGTEMREQIDPLMSACCPFLIAWYFLVMLFSR